MDIDANRPNSKAKTEGIFIMITAPTEVTCAVEVFIATALLHREQPNRPEFTIQEIVRRAAQEDITGEMRQGVNVHASQHCVANKAPNPNKHKMLYASGKNTRRLLLPNDHVHPDRTGKIFPDPGDVPERYLPLLDWAKQRFHNDESVSDTPVASYVPNPTEGVVPGSRSQKLIGAKGIGLATFDRNDGGDCLRVEGEEPRNWLGGLLKLRLAGAHLADGTDPDEHIRQLREEWD